MIEFQYYSGDIEKSRPIGKVTLSEFIETQLNPDPEMVGVFLQIEEASKNDDKKLKAELKMQNLHSYTISAVFKGRRRYADILEFTGLAQLDFDGLSESEAVDFRDYIFETYPQVICSYLSPSRLGVKVILRIPKIDIELGIDDCIKEYKAYYKAIEIEFGNYKGFDPAPKNLVLPLFVSYDYFMPTRDFDDTEIWDIKEEEEEPMYKKYPKPFKPYKKLKSNDKNELRAIRTVRKVINGITSSPGHYQLRSACLVFGTRIGAGYVHLDEALREVEHLVKNNAYLSKGVSGYLKTAEWGVLEGSKTPNNY
jgi:hypothetical protein